MVNRPGWWYEKVRPVLNFLSRRKSDYQLTFTQPAGKRVLQDLATFCRANDTCIIPGDRDRSLVLEGRREVYLRIVKHLKLSPEQLVDMFDAGHAYVPQQDDDK